MSKFGNSRVNLRARINDNDVILRPFSINWEILSHERKLDFQKALLKTTLTPSLGDNYNFSDFSLTTCDYFAKLFGVGFFGFCQLLLGLKCVDHMNFSLSGAVCLLMACLLTSWCIQGFKFETWDFLEFRDLALKKSVLLGTPIWDSPSGIFGGKIPSRIMAPRKISFHSHLLCLG